MSGFSNCILPRHIIDGIKAGSFKNITVLTGAGISTGAGIPDFRSPGGMYDTLRPELITATETQRRQMKHDPTQVVFFDLFRENQFPYLEVRRPFIMGTAEKKWKATLSHFFLRLLHDKGLLRRLYTQNIDGLDFQLDLPEQKVVHVHGTIGTASCEFCSAPYPAEEFREAVRTSIKNIYDQNDCEAPRESKNILCKRCRTPGVKPDTVMYGRNLPASFFTNCDKDFPQCSDLLIVIGTSLTVSPANSLVERISKEAPRIVVNTLPVGEELGLDYGSNSSRDFLLSGESDQVLFDLCIELGWVDDMCAFSDQMAPQSQQILHNYSARTQTNQSPPS